MRGDPPKVRFLEQLYVYPHARGSTRRPCLTLYGGDVYRMRGDPPAIDSGTGMVPGSTPHARGSTRQDKDPC